MEVDGEEHAIHIASDNDIIKKKMLKIKTFLKLLNVSFVKGFQEIHLFWTGVGTTAAECVWTILRR